jgi:hypothetical protein
MPLPALPLVPPKRFYESPFSRFIVTNQVGQTITFLDRLASNRTCTHTRNAPFSIEFDVPADHPEVNLPQTGVSGATFVDEGVCLVYWFLRYGQAATSSSAWEVAGAAKILNATDDGDDDSATTHVTAYDPWQLLYKLPVVDPETGELPDGDFPAHYVASNAAAIAYEVLSASLASYPDFKSHMHLDPDFIDDTTETEITVMEFTHGTTVGEAWDDLVKTADIDIYLKPIYHPDTRPGKLCELHIAPKLGQNRHQAIFSWDRWPRSVVDISRETDGGQRVNEILYYNGADQTPISPQSDAASIAKYGTYWETQSFPAEETADTVIAKAAKELNLRKNGVLSYSFSPAAERSPMPLKDYHIHDYVQVWASKRLRRPIANERMRVESIPISIDDDQLARVSELLVSVVPET